MLIPLIPRGTKMGSTSDHLPLWAEFHINELTQQLSQTINLHG